MFARTFLGIQGGHKGITRQLLEYSWWLLQHCYKVVSGLWVVARHWLVTVRVFCLEASVVRQL